VVAAILLTLRRREGVKSQNPGEQVRVKASDRVRIVKMESSQPATQAPDADAAEKAP
jgi:NADH-quinone oxidoreductase subunit J